MARTKYSIGDEVFRVNLQSDSPYVQRAIIRHIHINSDKDASYELSTGSNAHESHVFRTWQDACKVAFKPEIKKCKSCGK